MDFLKKHLNITAIIFFLLIASTSISKALVIDFTSIDSQLVIADYGDYDIVAINNTDSIWTDFHMELSLELFWQDTYEGPGTGILSHGFPDNHFFVLDIVDLSIAIGDTLEFSIVNTCNETLCPDGVELTVYPTIDGNGSTVPEPATLALMALGLAGLGFSNRKKTERQFKC